MPPQTLQRLLERLVGPVRAIRKLKGAMEVTFKNKEQLCKLTQDSGRVIDNKLVQVTPTRARWRVENILDWMTATSE